MAARHALAMTALPNRGGGDKEGQRWGMVSRREAEPQRHLPIAREWRTAELGAMVAIAIPTL